MNIKIAALGILFSGCNGMIYQVYGNQCFHNVMSEINLNKEAVDFNLARAETLLKGFLKEDVCEEFADTPIYILDRNIWGSPPVVGYSTALPKEVFIGKNMGSLVHELLHIYDFNRWNLFGSVNHINWENNGYNALDNQYWYGCKDPSIHANK